MNTVMQRKKEQLQRAIVKDLKEIEELQNQIIKLEKRALKNLESYKKLK